MRIVGVASVLCLLSLALSASAHAAQEYEPNDSRETAYGPLAGATSYTATFETDNDVDWYVFYIRTYSQMDFSASLVGSASCGPTHFELRDKDGESITVFHAGDDNEIDHLLRTLTAGRYYFEVQNEGCTGDRYQLRMDPAAAITTSRNCGEAIVARDAVGPQLTALGVKRAKNGEALARATAAVKSAKAALRRAVSHHASRWRRLQARKKLENAKAARGKVWTAKARLDALAGQYGQTLAAAEATIVSAC